ncbi:MAG: L,D-transpeptidase family protein [Candidatus Wildermuthbacteria bacterium]|nr:L,D-transpeptidase family protein [Candidatus Wildermuthbacteria bacterium]
MAINRIPFLHFPSVLILGSLLLFSISLYPHELSLEQEPPLLAQEKPKEQFRVVTGYEKVKADLLSKEGSFLEVNFPEKTIRGYTNGSVEKETSILAIGDPQGWGGTPAGLYSVLSGYELGFSSIARVYMPWAMQFYGKYYLHGEPYYPGGQKRITDVTGGCVQSSDQDAKTMFEFASVGMPVLVIDHENVPYEFTRELDLPFPALSAASYLVVDLDSGQVLAEKDALATRPVASLTKLMAAVVVVEQSDLRKSITVRPSMLEAYGSTEGLTKGKSFRLVELLYPMLIESSNDAAETVSGFLGRARTIELMNEKAKAISMNSSGFVDPSGFEKENVSSAEDIFRLLRYIYYNRPPILEITKGKEVNAFGDVRFTDLESKNIFADHSWFMGGKTGFIKASGYTGAFLFRIPINGKERTFAVVLLGSVAYLGDQSTKSETERVVSWIVESFSKEYTEAYE